MAVTYKKLWHILIDRNLKKKDLENMAGITRYQVYKLSGDKDVTNDVIGRIYEYFLNKFAKNIASDDGVFFTPKSLVKMIVNIIEPTTGVLLEMIIPKLIQFNYPKSYCA